MVKNFAVLAIQNYGDIVYNNNCQEGKESPGNERKVNTMKRSKKYYTAKAILMGDNGKQFEVTIYSLYETEEEANEGIKRFCSHGYEIVNTWIE